MIITRDMRIKNWIKRALSLTLALSMIATPVMPVFADNAVKKSNYVISKMDAARSELESIARSGQIVGCIYLKEAYTVRESSDAYSASVATVGSGQTVYITSVAADSGRNIWYKVEFSAGSSHFTGYVEREFIACADSRFLAWEDKYVTTLKREEVSSVTDTADIDMFPEEYRDALYELKKKHPEWTFVKCNTGLGFDSTIAAEGLKDKSLIYTKNKPSSYIEARYDSAWSYATDGIIAYYVDPRNFLDDTQIFQFELVSYNSKIHTLELMNEAVKGSFMEGNVNGSTSYAQAFIDIAKKYSLSPLYQYARIILEQGASGSKMISGTVSGYEGLYNYYNYGASGADNEALINGLKYARDNGWTSRVAALEGGAKKIANNYIAIGQDTYYFQKWDVSRGAKDAYSHQYMQDITAPSDNAIKAHKNYNAAGLLKDTPFVFRIPVYNSMPSGRQVKPDANDTLSLNMDNVENLPVDQNAVLIPYINGGENASYEIKYTSSNTNVATVDEKGVITGKKPGSATITAKAEGLNTISCSLNVIKADIAVDDIEKPEIEVTYSPDKTLGDIELPEGFAWADASTVPTVTNEGYTVNYSPDDSKYNSIAMTLDVKVNKAYVAADELSLPMDLEAEAGSELNNIALPIGYTWNDPMATVSGRTGSYIYKAGYCIDSDNYEPTKDIDITVNVKCSDHSFGEWSSPSGGYITRRCSKCDEEERLQVKEQVKEKDCLTDGHDMEDGKCNRCGYVEPVIQEHVHSYTESSESASCTKAGVKTFTCSCGDAYTEEIKALGHDYVNGTCSRCGDRLHITPAVTPVPSTVPPKAEPTKVPTPTVVPTKVPTPIVVPTKVPTVAVEPTKVPTVVVEPTKIPTPTAIPTVEVKVTPTPTVEVIPTAVPTTEPTKVVAVPTVAPTVEPTKEVEETKNPIAAFIEEALPLTGAIGGVEEDAPAALPEVAVQPTVKPKSEEVIATPEVTEEVTPEVTEAPEEEAKPKKQEPVKTVIELVDTTTLTADSLIGHVDETNKIEVVVGDGIVWDINLNGVDISTVNVDMNVSVGEADIPDNVLKKLKSDDVVLMTLSHDGAFGFNAVLNVNLGTDHDGKYANLYYYNPDTGKLELVDSVLVSADGVAAFNMKHASEYAITFTNKQQIAKTGPNMMLIGLLIAIVIGGAGVIGFTVYKVKTSGPEEDRYFDEED